MLEKKPACHALTCLLFCAVEAFVDTDQKYLQADSGANRDDGCTAVTAVLVGQNLVVANVGDSRAVLSKGGQGEVASKTAFRPCRAAPHNEVPSNNVYICRSGLRQGMLHKAHWQVPRAVHV